MVPGKGNAMLEEWNSKGGEKVKGRREGSGGTTDSGRIFVALGENRKANKTGRKEDARGSGQERR